jgi:hypothetical protein
MESEEAEAGEPEVGVDDVLTDGPEDPADGVEDPTDD